jgi:transposase-like protein
MKQLTLLCAMALVSFMACQKENASTPIIAADNYLSLKVGNYWIYTIAYVDPKGIETTAKELDSVYIEKDTLINGQTYFKMVSSTSSTILNCFSTKFIKDSLHYIVSEKGEKLFSSENFTDTLRILDNRGLEGIIKTRFYKMEKEDNVQSPIGTYNCLDYRMKGILVQPVDGKSERFCHTYYAKNIGIIKNTAAYISSGAFIKEDLIRYKVQ